MLLFGHLGLTLGAAVTLQGVILKYKSNKKAYPATGDESSVEVQVQPKSFSLSSIVKTLGRNIDIRVLLLGAILPDIIDKPLGLLGIGNGRSISHTLLFLIAFAFAGLLLYSRRKWKIGLVLASGVLLHLILDQMWLTHATLFWPTAGWQFTGGDPSTWFEVWKTALSGDLSVSVPEAIGLLIILGFGLFLIRQKKLGVFIKHGYMEKT